MGLLSKASSITSVSKLAFSNFIITHNIKMFAIFELKDNYYSIANSIGFDGASILSSYSTKDFWNGICPEEQKVYTYINDNKTLNPMLQFFSFELMEIIKTVNLYKTEDTIYMLCNKDFDDSLLKDISNIDYSLDNIDLIELNKSITKDNKLSKFQIDFKEAVSSFMSVKGKDIEDKENAKSIIYKELINRFASNLSPYATKTISESSIKVLINLDKSVTNEHIICHIVYNLRNVLGKTAEMISFNAYGEADSLAETKSFLQVD